MEIKMFYKSQIEVSKVINQLIDAYWNNQIEEKTLLENIEKIIRYNKSKIIKDDDFTTVLKQKCGERRLDVLVNILELIKK